MASFYKELPRSINGFKRLRLSKQDPYADSQQSTCDSCKNGLVLKDDSRMLPSSSTHPTTSGMSSITKIQHQDMQTSSLPVVTSALLQIVPNDVLFRIATTYLDFDSFTALRQTCQSLYHLLNPTVLKRVRGQIVEEFLATETDELRVYRELNPRSRLDRIFDLFVYTVFDVHLVERTASELCCYGCLQVKPLWHFVERMSSRGTGLGGKSARDRVCKDCMHRGINVCGTWWKENWIRTGEQVRQYSRSDRLRRWLLEGKSLVNATEEIGICSKCKGGNGDLWWGCRLCFQKEEKRRQAEDKEDLSAISRTLISLAASWETRQDKKRQRRGRNRYRTGVESARERRRRQRKWWQIDEYINVEGSHGKRRDALREWKENKKTNASANDTKTSTVTDGQLFGSDKGRMESRCAQCWVPHCPSRRYLFGLAYQKTLLPEYWCEECRNEYHQRALMRGKSTQIDVLGVNDMTDSFARLFGHDEWMNEPTISCTPQNETLTHCTSS